MFLTGPGIVREVMGEDVDAQELGGPRVHSKNGVCQFVADGRPSTPRRSPGSCSAFLPSHAGEQPPHGGPAAVPTVDPSSFVPESQRSVYDVRDVIGALVGRRRACSRCPSAGRATWSRPSAASTAAPSA